MIPENVGFVDGKAPKELDTQYTMTQVIERALAELQKMPDIVRVKNLAFGPQDEEGPRLVIVNTREFAAHLARTLNGELLEFDLIRRFSSIFRELPLLMEHLRDLDNKARDYERLRSAIRVPAEG